MTTMMTAPAGAEPDAVTLQIPAIPMTWEQASIMLDATFDAWRMLSGEIDAARGDDWQWIQEILALPAHTRYIKAAGDEAMVCSAAMRETWPGRWHDLLRARVQDVIDALVSHEREIRAMDPGMFARMPSPDEATGKERKTMRIIIDGHGRIDRQAMAVERLKTIDMTPAGGGDAQDWVGAWLDGFDQALDLCRALETALDADMGKELSGDAR